MRRRYSDLADKLLPATRSGYQMNTGKVLGRSSAGYGDIEELTVGTGAGTVTSVAMTVPAEFAVAGSPVTTIGTLAVTKANQSANTVWAGPTSGGAAAPAFRALVAGDFPGGIGAGTVTSVGLTLPSIISVSGSPVTGSGTLAGTLATQTANTVFAGPTTGSAAAPTFRALVAADIQPLTYQWLQFAISDQSTAITTGTAKFTTRFPACTVLAVRASLNTASSSGIPTVDINESGTTILSTKLTIDAGEKTSETATTSAIISDATIADDAEITFDIDVAGTGAKGLIVSMKVRWT